LAELDDLIAVLSRRYRVPRRDISKVNRILKRSIGFEDAVLLTDLVDFADIFSVGPLGLAEYIQANGTRPPKLLAERKEEFQSHRRQRLKESPEESPD
jgi:hypothetical protein